MFDGMTDTGNLLKSWSGMRMWFSKKMTQQQKSKPENVKKVWVFVLSQLTVREFNEKKNLRFCLHILIHFCWYNSLATYVYTALRTVISFFYLYFSMFGLYSSCLFFFLFCVCKEETMYRKKNRLCGHSNLKSKRQTKTSIHSEKWVLWRVRYSFFCTDENQLIRCRNLLSLVFVSCMNIWLWEKKKLQYSIHGQTGTI